MSVFSDFQRMWVQRFPQSTLSDAWEQDVRGSLSRHKQKISELTKELEQEQLYVEYLERLLNDVEKYRNEGGNPTALFEAATPSVEELVAPAAAAVHTNSTQLHLQQKTAKDKEDYQCEKTLIKSSSTPEPSTTVDKSKPAAQTNGSAEHIVSASIETTTTTTTTSSSTTSTTSTASSTNDEQSQYLENKLVQLRKDTALNQCINELTSNMNFRRCVSEVPSMEMTNSMTVTTTAGINESDSMKARRNSQNDMLKTPSHFVTVIEVKDNKLPQKNDVVPEETVEQVTPAPVPTSAAATAQPVAAAAPTVEVIKEVPEVKVEATPVKPVDVVHLPSATKTTTSSTTITSAASVAAALDAKKKVPPRPPPKYIRRAAPVEPPTVPTAAAAKMSNEAKSESLERNIKPSEILRQKSSDSLDVKLLVANRKTTPESKLSKSSELAEEFGRKMGKSDSLEKNTRRPSDAILHEMKATKNSQSPTGSLGKANASPTGSLSKFGNHRSTESPTGSLGKPANKLTDSLQSVGSKESLASQGAISERIKSYESISSLSSDSMKVGGQHLEYEPYYDTVPLDNGDGDYVYIAAGGTGSTSSRDDLSNAGSTLPMPAAHTRNSHLSSQTSVHQTEPESPGRSSNYVNIDYFLQQILLNNRQNNEIRSSSIDSDGESEPPALMRAISHDDNSQQTPGMFRKNSMSPGNRSTAIRHITTSIINSETLYVECLHKMMQYMKAIRVTLTTSQPVISEEEYQTMFFKIQDLYEVHTNFLDELKQKVDQEGDIYVGETVRRLASHINLYGAFLHNYGRAIDTVKKCGANNEQFKNIVSKIVLNSQNEQSLTLEDLLHKPVARVQKNALVLQDLINQTPSNHPDFAPLQEAQKRMRSFLSEFNVVQTKSMFPSDDKALRRLVRNSFIVELADGHRKLRHLLLFNDVIACAKYKASGRDRFEFELKWFIPLKDIVILEDGHFDPKETSPVNILQLKSQACTVRDQILMEEKEDKKQNARDKHRKKLADIEAQLVLASPNLIFRIGNKSANKMMTFFLSSEFERTQWIESIRTLQQSCNLPGVTPVNIYELQAWITACQALIKTEMGSYLMRNSRDESLLVGDLHLTVHGLIGIDHPADLFICVEVDSYGHYFSKAKTKLICRNAAPVWNESFVLELEGSQNVRVLVYEDQVPKRLRASCVIKLSRQWLRETTINRALKMTDAITLNTAFRFVPGEVTLRRVPTSKPGALFGAKMQQVLKREKRDIPFIISACIREVERRGMGEVGIYRVSGSASDLARLKKSFETNPYEAEQLLKEVDIHSATGILKSYLRELPEALFTDHFYPRLLETFNNYSNFNDSARIDALIGIFQELPIQNKTTINFILDHLIRVHQMEIENKMSLHNLAMVFGPTLLRPGPQITKQKDLLEMSTVDVMAQAGILYCFLQARLK